jgi:ornithine cyclodeaminase/alanine dehydrogenase-like protein (mu-crystallin family)
MLTISADQIQSSLTFPSLIEELRCAFKSSVITPLRAHHALEQKNAADATLLIMPAWDNFSTTTGPENTFIGLKTVTIFPDNGQKNLPTVMGLYVLLAGDSGRPLAVLDGQALTLWRTACASGLAASYLAREGSTHLLMVGAGALAPFLIRAHAAIRPINSVKIWNRNFGKAESLAHSLSHETFQVEAVKDLEPAAREADIISCATISDTPLVLGKWLKPGSHLDLVGAFRPDLRESDDEAVIAARVFVDTRAGALSEAGDLVQPIQKGLISAQHVVADLRELTCGKNSGRQTHEEKTLFKSVGTALEDLAAAKLVYKTIA